MCPESNIAKHILRFSFPDFMRQGRWFPPSSFSTVNLRGHLVLLEIARLQIYKERSQHSGCKFR